MKQKTSLIQAAALALLASAGVSHAGFVDARGDSTGAANYVPPPAMNAAPVLPFIPPPPPAVAKVVPSIAETSKVAGDIIGKAWRSKLAKSPKGGVSISRAIYLVIPPSVVSKGLEIDNEISTTKKYSWSAGKTRAAVLRDIARDGGLYINVSNAEGVTVQKANPPEPQVQAPAPIALMAPRVREPLTPAPVFGPTTPPSQTAAVTYGPTPNQAFAVRASGTNLPPLAGRPMALDAPAVMPAPPAQFNAQPAIQPAMMRAQPAPLDSPPARDVEYERIGSAAGMPQPTMRSGLASPTPLPTMAPTPIPQSVAALPLPSSGGPLVIAQGQRLMPALRSWLSARGVDLSWEATGNTQGKIRDVMLDSPVRIASQDIPTVLTEVLSPFGFEAQIQQGSPARVIVKNAAMEGYQQ